MFLKTGGLESVVAPEHQWSLGPGEEWRAQWRAEGLIINWSLSAEWRAGLEDEAGIVSRCSKMVACF